MTYNDLLAYNIFHVNIFELDYANQCYNSGQIYHFVAFRMKLQEKKSKRIQDNLEIIRKYINTYFVKVHLPHKTITYSTNFMEYKL